MNFKLQNIFALLSCMFTVLSCSDETVDEPSIQINGLQSCSTIVVNGNYVNGMELTNNEYITVKVNVVKTGRYVISTSLVNGYKYVASGDFVDLGVQDIVLEGTGTPIGAQTDTFTISYGISDCEFTVGVSPKDFGEMDKKIIISSGKPHMSDNYYVYALDGNGNLLWSKLGFGQTAAVADDIVYLNINGHLYALDVRTGDQMWSNETVLGNFNGAVTLMNGTLYSSSKNGKLYALDSSNGQIKWSYQTEVSAVMSSVPVVQDGIVCFGAPDDHIYVLDLMGNLKWKYMTGATDVRSSPAISNDKVYVGADDGKLYVLNVLTGELIWDFEAGISGEYSPTLSNDKVYVQSDQAIFCLDATSGSKIWDYPLASTISDWSSPTERNNMLYVCGTNNGLLAFDAGNGSVQWKNTSFGTATRNSPSYFEDRIYLASPGGLVAIDAVSGKTKWIYGEYDPWNASNIKSFYTSPVIYDTGTKMVGYPSDSGNKQ